MKRKPPALAGDEKYNANYTSRKLAVQRCVLSRQYHRSLSARVYRHIDTAGSRVLQSGYERHYRLTRTLLLVLCISSAHQVRLGGVGTVGSVMR